MRSFPAPAAHRLPVLALLLALGACATPVTEAPLSFPEPSRLSVAPAAGAPRLQGVTTYFGGRIPVFVAPSAVPQVLHLSSVNSSLWHVYLLPGANVTTIYLSGFDPQRLVVHRAARDGAAPPRIVDLGRNLLAHHSLSFGPPILLSDQRQAAYRAELRTVTGLDLTDFQGHENVLAGQAFVLGGPADVRRLRAFFPGAFVRRTRPAAADFARIRRDIGTLVARGALPAALPLWSDHMRLDEDRVPTWPVLAQAPATLRQPARSSDCGEVQLGTDGDDDLRCDWGVNRIPYAVARTRWVVAGEGHDLVIDGEAKSQVLSGGRGDDIIDTGLGNDVIHFGRGWGNDVLVIRCDVQRREWAAMMPRNPRYRTSRYVVFGSGIRPADLAWTGPNEIVHRPSGSRIRFYDWPCLHFVAVEPGRIPEPPAGEPDEDD